MRYHAIYNDITWCLKKTARPLVSLEQTTGWWWWVTTCNSLELSTHVPQNGEQETKQSLIKSHSCGLPPKTFNRRNKNARTGQDVTFWKEDGHVAGTVAPQKDSGKSCADLISNIGNIWKRKALVPYYRQILLWPQSSWHVAATNSAAPRPPCSLFKSRNIPAKVSDQGWPAHNVQSTREVF